MNLIDEFMIIINQNKLDFAVDSLKGFSNSTHEVALFSYYLQSLYGEKNYLVENNKMIKQLEKVINKEHLSACDFSGFQYELQIDCNSEFTYLEKWGLCTRIKTTDFLGVFISIQRFLNRWDVKEELLIELEKHLEKIKNSSSNNDRVFVFHKKIRDNDFLRLIISKELLEVDSKTYLNMLKLPQHLAQFDR